jgi:hypothetical protein
MNLLDIRYCKAAIKATTAHAVFTRHEEQKVLNHARKKWHIAGVASATKDIDKCMEEAYGAQDFFDIYQNLRHSRTVLLRRLARAQYLAYGFLNNLKYRDIEGKTVEANSNKIYMDRAIWPEVEGIVFCYVEDNADNRQRFEGWLQEAKGIENEPQRIMA